jgi:putative DNA primase/helicase
MTSMKPLPLPVSPGGIPAELKALTQWVGWSYENQPERKAKKLWTKVPKNPATGSNASSTNPETWGTFSQAMARCQGHGLDGIGFVVTKDDDYVAIDLDGCRNPEAGEIHCWAQAIIDRFGSYTEVSPSGTGIRIFVKGRLPPHGRKKGAIEIYEAARFVTVTGCHLTKTSSTIEERQAEIEAFHAEVFGEHRNQGNRQGQTAGYGDAPSSGLSDEVILEKACRAVNAEKFLCLWSGDISHYASPSEADLALCCLLVFWSHDPVQIDRLFRQSALMRPKWDEQRGDETYAQRTIRHALAQVTESWMPPRTRNGGPPTDEPLMPPLPKEAQVVEALAAEASLWLDDYTVWSGIWAPRAFEGFHEACGLFTLATVAARRIKIQFGHGVYTSLYMALAARTTLYTKTTGADLAIELLKRAGLGFLLADDDATPQAFLHALTARVPEHCEELSIDGAYSK